MELIGFTTKRYGFRNSYSNKVGAPVYKQDNFYYMRFYYLPKYANKNKSYTERWDSDLLRDVVMFNKSKPIHHYKKIRFYAQNLIATYWRIVKGKTASIEFDLAVSLLRYAGYKITVK